MNSTYTYDNVGNITSINDAVDDIWDQVFVYDDLNRLTAQTNTGFAGGSASYTYNKIGNMMSKNGINYTYSSGTHQVITAGSNSYTYDANGNMETSPNRTYTYDYEDRLSSISGDISATYTYDGNGERVKKVENGVTTYYINQYYEVRDSVGIKYYYANGQKVAQDKGGVKTWYHQDHLKSSSRLTDAGGNEVRIIAYKPFGEDAYNQGSISAPDYKYTGKEQDTTGLYYYGARYYDPVLARFIQADTIHDRGPQGLNRYSYVVNNPIVYTDPTGRCLGLPYNGLSYTAWVQSYLPNYNNSPYRSGLRTPFTTTVNSFIPLLGGVPKDLKVTYSPPDVPASISVDPLEGEASLGTSNSISTPFGTFSVEVSIDNKGKPDSGISYSPPVVPIQIIYGVDGLDGPAPITTPVGDFGVDIDYYE